MPCIGEISVELQTNLRKYFWKYCTWKN